MQAIGVADLIFYSTNSASGVAIHDVGVTALLTLPTLLAMLVSARWAQWAGGAILLLMNATWAFLFVGGLH